MTTYFVRVRWGTDGRYHYDFSPRSYDECHVRAERILTQGFGFPTSDGGSRYLPVHRIHDVLIIPIEEAADVPMSS